MSLFSKQFGQASALRNKLRLQVEALEERINMSWGATPPATITPPTSYTSVTLNSSGDATGNASVATTEIDWYRFTAATGGSYILESTTPSSSLDTVAAAYTAAGSRVGYNDDLATGNTDSRFTVTLTAGQVYFFGVTNYTGTAAGSYTWRIDGPAGTPPPSDDSYENNDTLATAWNLGTLASSSTISNLKMADAADYFKFTMGGAGTSANSVSIAFTHSQGDLDLKLYNSAGTQVGSSAGTGNSETISLNGMAAGTYTVYVYGYNGAQNPNYSLTINPATGGGGGGGTNAWTVMVYITASNLQSFAHADINEMETALNSGMPSNVKIAVFWDQSNSLTKYSTGAGSQAAWGTAGRAILSADSNTSQVGTSFEILGEQNTGSGATLTSFVSWAMTAAPATNYALLMWNHGAGFYGSNYDDSDGAGSDNLTIAETATALTAAGMPRFKVLGYDACLMAMGEIGYALRNTADVFVGSEELEPGAGHDYRTLLNVLKTNPASVTAEQLGAGMVTSYQNQYGPGSSIEDTYSATRTSQYAAFATALQAFTNATLSATAADRTAMRTARNGATEYGEGSYPDFRDLGKFMTAVAANTSITAAIRTAATGVNTAITNLVVSKTADERASSGVAIYLPGSSYDSSYATLNSAFNAATGWGSFASWLATGARSGGGGGGSGGGKSGPAQRVINDGAALLGRIQRSGNATQILVNSLTPKSFLGTGNAAATVRPGQSFGEWRQELAARQQGAARTPRITPAVRAGGFSASLEVGAIDSLFQGRTPSFKL